jgi:hypothetical protein
MADREDEVRSTELEMDRALAKLRESKPGKHTFGLEAQYGQAYQRLVRLGARHQLRLKHRGQ